MDTGNFTLRKLTPTIGAEVFGIDLTEPPTAQRIGQLRTLLLQHQVIFFRDQALSHEQHLALGRGFGSLHTHALANARHRDHPELLIVHADAKSKYVAGEGWHSDVTCDAEPPMASMLHLTEVPPEGGDTMFASMYAAYDALSDAMKSFLETLTAIHDGAKPYVGAYGAKPVDIPFARTEHPVVTVHPETGRKVLFVNSGFTTRIVQLKRSESDALLQYLYRHIEAPQFMCRFRWEKNSVAFWDNRCTQHQAVWDYYPNRRRGYRVTLNGTVPQAANPALKSVPREALAA